MLARKSGLLLVLLVAISAAAQPAPAAASSGETRAAAYMERVRSNPLLLAAFLREMPKGGDLHNHVTGAVYAESYLQWAADDGICIDRKALAFAPKPCDSAKDQVPATTALQDPILYRQMIDALSMRHFSGALESGHDHFFDTFGKMGAVSHTTHTGQMVAEVVARAASQNVQYMELMVDDLDRGAGLQLGQKLGWNDDFERMRQQLAPSEAEIVAGGRKFIDEFEADMRRTLRCDQPVLSKEERERRERAGQRALGPDAGCKTTVRYIFEIYRGLPKEMVFAQMQMAFALAAADPRVVSVNPVMPEDAYVPMHDYDLHMRMFDFFHQRYPNVHLTLHAGELAPKLVPPRRLHDHIRDAIEHGHAERIGHGVDILWEDEPFELMREMREKNVLVEICLTSNDYILGVRGGDHPLPVYLKYGVPVALATDDEGVSRSDITHEYLRGVQAYGLKYADLKKMARASVDHAFADAPTRTKVKQQLESAFAEFERECCR
jgi:adenosine deaminase